MEEMARLAGQVGFPVVMVLWFAWRLEQKLDEHTRAIQRQTNILLLLYAKQTGKSKEEIARMMGEFEEVER